MINLKYKARDQKGNCKTGIKQVADKQDLLVCLRQQDLTPVSVEKITSAKNSVLKQKKRKHIFHVMDEDICLLKLMGDEFVVHANPVTENSHKGKQGIFLL